MKYSIDFIRTDSNNDMIEPYKDKIFDSKLDVKKYLKRHPKAKGAKIIKIKEGI